VDPVRLIAGDSADSKRWGALAALAVTVLVVVGRRMRGEQFDALIIEIGEGVFFAGLVVLAFVAAESVLLGLQLRALQRRAGRDRMGFAGDSPPVQARHREADHTSGALG